MNTYIDRRFLAAEDTLIQYFGADESMSLPARLGNVQIKRIGSGSICNNKLSYLSVPEGVETIGSNAVLTGNLLKTLVLPSTLRNIGDNAFGEFTDIQTIKFNGLGYSEQQYRTLEQNSVRINGTKMLALNMPDHELFYNIENRSMKFAKFIPVSFGCLFKQNEPSTCLSDSYELLNTDGGLKKYWENSMIKTVIKSGKESYIHNETENRNDLDSVENSKLAPEKTAVFVYDAEKTKFSGDMVYLDAKILRAYWFWQSVVPIKDGSSMYYLYRRCYLTDSEAIKYVTMDMGIFDSGGNTVEKERATEIYEKYEFMRIL